MNVFSKNNTMNPLFRDQLPVPANKPQASNLQMTTSTKVAIGVLGAVSVATAVYLALNNSVINPIIPGSNSTDTTATSTALVSLASKGACAAQEFCAATYNAAQEYSADNFRQLLVSNPVLERAREASAKLVSDPSTALAIVPQSTCLNPISSGICKVAKSVGSVMSSGLVPYIDPTREARIAAREALLNTNGVCLPKETLSDALGTLGLETTKGVVGFGMFAYFAPIAIESAALGVEALMSMSAGEVLLMVVGF